ncbi:MAG: DUF5655 domain-containing protein [Patescibacteria group bacterium]
MWTCPKCSRIFKSKNQPHSCKKIPLEKHFEGKEKAKELFGFLVEQIDSKIGKCKIVSIPCCVHLFGKYDFLAALPKKDRLEIRIALDRKLDSSRLKVSVPLSSKSFKNCFDVSSKEEIDKEFIGWLKESYHLKD